MTFEYFPQIIPEFNKQYYHYILKSFFASGDYSGEDLASWWSDSVWEDDVGCIVELPAQRRTQHDGDGGNTVLARSSRREEDTVHACGDARR